MRGFLLLGNLLLHATYVREFFVIGALAVFFCPLSRLPAQSDDEAVRVTMTMNPDGSKTVYRVDGAKHESVATTTTASGKPGGKIIYQLDDQGRYESGRVFAPNGAFRFKTIYRYNSAGQLAEESQLDKDDTVRHKIVYSFDADGHATGYAIYDGAGALLGRTTPKAPAAKSGRRR